jgi:hypothetical protein
MHMTENPPPFRAVAPGLGVPMAVENAVMKALVKDRNQRYATVLDFSRAFSEAALGGGRVNAGTYPPPAGAPGPPGGGWQQPGANQPLASTVVPVPAPLNSQPVYAPPVGPELRPATTGSGVKVALWVGVPLLVMLGLGVWFVSSATHQGSGGGAQNRIETPRQPEPVPPVKPPEMDHRQAVESAKTQGDIFYANGEYDNAINAYQEGLKLDPTNPQLLQALQSAQTAKAAEEKMNH